MKNYITINIIKIDPPIIKENATQSAMNFNLQIGVLN